MQAGYVKPGEVLRSWLLALTGIRDNPLLAQWLAQDRTLAAQRPWWQRNPVLRVITLIFALLSSVLFWRAQLSLSSLPAGTLTRQMQAQNLLKGALFLIASLLAVLAWIWLSQRFYLCAQLALGFLQPPPASGKLRRSLDDLLAVASLSEAELVCAVATYSLHRLLLPLTSATLAAGLAAWTAAHSPLLNSLHAGVLMNPAYVAPSQLPTSLLLKTGITWVAGLLGILCSTLLLLSLSPAQRASLAPQTGAALHSFLNFGFGGLLCLTMFGAAPSSSSDLTGGIDNYDAVLGVLSMALFYLLLIFLARRWNWLRLTLVHGLLWPGLLITAGLTAIDVVGGNENPYLGGVSMIGLVLFLAAFCPFLPLAPVEWIVSDTNAGSGMLLVGMLLQLALLPFLAALARDAVQRRKWSSA